MYTVRTLNTSTMCEYPNFFEMLAALGVGTDNYKISAGYAKYLLEVSAFTYWTRLDKINIEPEKQREYIPKAFEF
jgi:hypothetical protein